MVHHIVPVQDQLRNGENGVALLDEILQNGGQSLRGVEGGVVKEDDASRLDLAGDPVIDSAGIIVLPVQAVPKRNRVKSLCRNSLQTFDDVLQVSDF